MELEDETLGRRSGCAMAAPVAILANGDFPCHPRPLAILRSAARVVCCDGAAAAFVRHENRLPDLVVGDLDSLPPDLRETLARDGHVIRCPGQDDNDLAKAFDHCLSRGWTAPVLLGATGRREDHALGNIGHLFDFALRAPAVTMVTDHGVFTPVVPGDTRRFDSRPGEAVSLFAAAPGTRVTVRGLRWPLDDAPLPRWWSGTLNLSESPVFDVSAAGGPVLVYQAFDPERGKGALTPEGASGMISVSPSFSHEMRNLP